jgi:hypothetical protein
VLSGLIQCRFESALQLLPAFILGGRAALERVSILFNIKISRCRSLPLFALRAKGSGPSFEGDCAQAAAWLRPPFIWPLIYRAAI